MSHSRVLVIISVYNEYQKLNKIVDSLQKQTLKPSKTVIIDDGSPDMRVGNEIAWLKDEYPQLKINGISTDVKSEPNLDTIGIGFKDAWFRESGNDYDYVCLLNSDMVLNKHYLRDITKKMRENHDLVCASGAIVVQEDYIEEINIGAKVGRKDARGSGKVISTNFLYSISGFYFPDVAWDTWINTRAKIKGLKAKQINGIVSNADRPTTRVVKKDLYRSGRLTYHFGYNPILTLMKTALAGRGAKQFLKGYRSARKEKWKLIDDEVRKFFGWRFFLHPLK